MRGRLNTVASRSNDPFSSDVVRRHATRARTRGMVGYGLTDRSSATEAGEAGLDCEKEPTASRCSLERVVRRRQMGESRSSWPLPRLPNDGQSQRYLHHAVKPEKNPAALNQHQ